MRQLLIGIVIGLALLWTACGDEQESEPAPGKVRQSLTQVIDTTEGDCDDSLGCIRIEIAYDLLPASHQSPARQKINSTIEKLALRSGVDTADTSGELNIVGSSIESYRQLRDDFPEFRQEWVLERSVYLETDTCGILGFRYDNFEYTGGAHPNSDIQLLNLLSATGERLALDSLLVPGGRDSLDTMGERFFRRYHQIHPDSTLGSAGFWIERGMFHLNDNFLVGDSGLTFVFNNYEIGPYALGDTELYLPYDSIGQLIRLDCLTGKD